MCTVTFIPTSDGFYFTSSRDEKSSRATIPPLKYTLNGMDIYFPKDELAGGTWFATNEFGRTACLLNGAFERHEKALSYRKSRGLILLESFKYDTIEEFHQKIDLDNIEPFTLLLLNSKLGSLLHFYELKWDGKNKHFRELSKKESQIWSSSTLYNSEVRKKRTDLFEKWVDENQAQQHREILKFHNRKHGLNQCDDLIMKGEGDLQTVSISQIHLSNQEIQFNYFDLIANSFHSIELKNNRLCQTV